MLHTVTKSFRDFPAAHRQPEHDGHCRWIHGHNWGFDITLTCIHLDLNGFVFDVGKLQDVKAFLVDTFDHTLLLNETDPHLADLRDFMDGGHGLAIAKIVVVPNCGMEGLAQYVATEVQEIIEILPGAEERSVRVLRVTCWEDSKNFATFTL